MDFDLLRTFYSRLSSALMRERAFVHGESSFPSLRTTTIDTTWCTQSRSRTLRRAARIMCRNTEDCVAVDGNEECACQIWRGDEGDSFKVGVERGGGRAGLRELLRYVAAPGFGGIREVILA